MTKEEELKNLKSQAYDCLAQLEIWQAKLKQFNQQIAQLSQQPEKKENKK